MEELEKKNEVKPQTYEQASPQHIYATSEFPGKKCETCINCESEIENQYPGDPNSGVVYAAMWGNGRHCRVRADLPGTSPGMFDDLHGQRGVFERTCCTKVI